MLVEFHMDDFSDLDRMYIAHENLWHIFYMRLNGKILTLMKYPNFVVKIEDLLTFLNKNVTN